MFKCLMAYNLQSMKTNIKEKYKVNVRGGGLIKEVLFESSFFVRLRFFDNIYKTVNTQKTFKGGRTCYRN